MINLLTPDWEIDNIETVLFDKDGTFIDLHHFWGKMTELRALEIIRFYKLSDEKLELLCQFLGYDFKTKKMIPDGITALYSRKVIIEIFTKKLCEEGVYANESEIEKIFDTVSTNFYKNITDYTKPINEAVDFIKMLHKKGIKLGIVTSDSVESTNLTLIHFNWEKLFGVVIGRESSEHTKESGVPTKMALEKINANPKTTLMIGDAPMDYISAKNAEIDNIILVATGQISKDELQKTTPCVVESLKDVKCLKI